CSSSRSALVSPPSPLPASRWACLTQSPIVQAEGPNSLDSDAGVRPVPTNATICRLNSGAYRTVLSAMVNSSKSNDEVSTKPGQLHSSQGVARTCATNTDCLRELDIRGIHGGIRN